MKPQNSPEKVALITGTSSGFGLLASVALAKEGFRVVASMRNLRKQDELVEMAKQSNVWDRIDTVQLDVTNSEDVTRIVENVHLTYGRIDLLINNAGYATGGFVEEVPIEEWRRQFETNFFGTVSVTKAVLPIMRQQRNGKILNISSISGQIAFPAMGPYVASKFALEGFTETLRLEMLPYCVHVVLIEPGSYKTAIWEKGLEAMSQQEDTAYKQQTRSLLRSVRKIADSAGNPSEVVQIILQVVRAEYPKLRYPIGKGVKGTIRFKQLLPWNWVERIIIRNVPAE